MQGLGFLVESITDFARNAILRRHERKRLKITRKKRKEATAARLEAAEQGFNSRDNIMEALAREEMIIIHHNHAIASELRRERNRFSAMIPDAEEIGLGQTEGEESKLDQIINVESVDGTPLLRDYSLQ